MNTLKLFGLVLRRRAFPALLVVLLVAAVVGLLAGTTRRDYVATATLFMRAPDVKSSASAYQGDLFSRQRVVTYQDLVTSPDLARRVVDKLSLRDQPQDLVTKVSADNPKNTVLLDISVTDPDRRHAVDLANGYAQVFGDYIGEVEHVDKNSDLPPLATVVAPADTAHTTRAGMPPVLVAVVAAVVAALAVVAVVVALEFADRRIRSRRRIEAIAGVPVLGVLGSTEAHSDGDRGPSPEAERLAVTVAHRLRGTGSEATVLVAGASSADGADGVAEQLRATLADRGVNVVEGDGDPESLAFAQAAADADRALAVVRPGVTSRVAFANLMHALRVSETEVVGVVVVGARTTATVAGIYA
ncbi:hypothetical protein P0W64_01490 [Tsukamurella sp. 8F]|uniref:YveK family protein n=1 Tax=unclassified Tsukamurella TaxID=2633480 RepID=UPI0023B95D83|nr:MULTISPECIES: hypothetical protein [unclassified Tsukamurella]MDF0531089.1 hypothetical protein [Tsukamurella sp. 8J]MDF0585444.1 hypothetical protein [Tsukamurella sp. 8F]